MDQPITSPATDAPTAATMHAGIEQRLERIEHHIEKIAEHQDIPLEDEQGPPKKASKPLMATAFGFAGLKLGGFTLGKFGLSADLINAYRRNKVEGLKDVAYAFFNAGDKEKGVGKHVPFMFAGAFVGASAGAIGGALLGWNRGDRLRNAGELFTHPIDSMKKILSSKPHTPAPVVSTNVEVTTAPSQEIKVTVTTEPPPVVSPAQHDGTVVAASEVQLAH